MGLGSILGTGLFVSLAFATNIAGDGIFVAIVLAAVVATLNGLSSAQLAAAHPVSGGTYEYGYRFLGSYWGFSAGWMFLVAKSASAATAVMGSVAYFFYLIGAEVSGFISTSAALGVLVIVTVLVAGGISRSNRANMLIVGTTLAGLAVLVITGLLTQSAPAENIDFNMAELDPNNVLYATALMFVAYTGYGRIATLGEEVVNPRKTISKAIILSMVVIVSIYLLVTYTAISTLGAVNFGKTLGSDGAPLMIVAEAMRVPGVAVIVSVAAITAMIGVLLNLILGLSRVMLGMARRRDIPAKIGEIRAVSGSPVVAVWVTAAIIGALVLSGDITFTWSFSAFTVLIYYSITNLAAMKLPSELRLYPRWVPICGLISCLGLAFWIEPGIWVPGLGVLVVGLVWHAIARKRSITQ